MAFNPRDSKDLMTPERLNETIRGYPTAVTAIRLLATRLTIIPNQGGRVLNISGGGKGKKSPRYPPTTNPTVTEPATQPKKRCFRSRKTNEAAAKFANGPKITSMVPMK